ncbi:MAG: FKBP-type peptidyl-prolyl cis-trans isomerase [Acidobacteriota bacterium]|nr:FKBP-type peptidyl-prolyl cis-trans isomerase [Acidobacteriota bacterium]
MKKTLRWVALGLLVLCVGSAAADIPPPDDVAAVPADAETTDSGLASRVLEPGTGSVPPGPQDGVVFSYTAWTADGKMFDSSVARKQALRASLSTLIKGLSEGLQLMVAGEKRRLWIPAALAYKGLEKKPQGMLVFDVELREIARHPETPEDVAEVPADAVLAKKGLASRVLVAGNGTRRPRASDSVVVHYSGWTTDGNLFDSSLLRGKPARFSLQQVIRGWTLGLQLMVEGEKRRFWIPEKMAYGGEKGKPQGMLIFDIELVSIE